MFYNRYVALCAKKGVSPSRAAIEAGISKSLVSKWKSNESKEPSPEVVRKLAEYFGISAFEVLEDAPQKETPAEKASVTDDDIKFALSGGEDIITDAQYDEVKKFVQFIKERDKRDKS